MVWNSLNDPLIAYYMDSAHWEEDSRTAHRGKGGKVNKEREDMIIIIIIRIIRGRI